jgi:sulfite exporter TauE/SafE
MKARPATPLLLWHFLTLGISSLVWCKRSKDEVNQQLGKPAVPSIWWFLVPFGGYWWAWLYAQAVEAASKGKLKYANTFGFFIIATSPALLGMSIFQTFSDNSSRSGPMINHTLVGVFAILYSLIIVEVTVIFPYIMQRRYNDYEQLSQPQTNPLPPNMPA